MKKKITDEQFLEKLSEACLDIEKTPKIEQSDKFKIKFLNEISKNKVKTSLRRKLVFSCVTSALALILILTSFFLILPKEYKRYSDKDNDVIIQEVSATEFKDYVKEEQKYLVDINTDNIMNCSLYEINSQILAIKISYIDESYLFVTFNKDFIYSDKDNFNLNDTTITENEKYKMYETSFFTQIGRKTIIDYYLWIETPTYDYYINIKNSNEIKKNMFVEKILEKI